MIRILALGLFILSMLPRVAAGQVLAYLADNSHLLRIDLETLSFTHVGDMGLPVEGLALAPSGQLYGVSPLTDQLLTIDVGTGAAAVVGPLMVDVVTVGGLAFDLAGNLWMSAELNQGTTFGQPRFLSIDPTSGAATEIASLELSTLSFRGNTLYGVSSGQGLGTIDPLTGSVNSLGDQVFTDVSNCEAAGSDFDAAGRLWVLCYARGGLLSPPQPMGALYLMDVHAAAPTANAVIVDLGTGLAIAPPRLAPPTEVPALAPVGLGVLALLLGLAGAWTARRFRSPSAS